MYVIKCNDHQCMPNENMLTMSRVRDNEVKQKEWYFTTPFDPCSKIFQHIVKKNILKLIS